MTLKPGDLVRYDRMLHDETFRVGIVVEGWATILDGQGALDVAIRSLSLVAAGSEDDERAAVLAMVARRAATYHTKVAREIALRRGWRPLDAGDVELVPTALRVMRDRTEIGKVRETTPGQWHWVHVYGPHWRPAKDQDDGVAQVLARENAERARG